MITTSEHNEAKKFAVKILAKTKDKYKNHFKGKSPKLIKINDKTWKEIWV